MHEGVTFVRYHSTFIMESIKFEFQDLLGIYARKKLYDAKVQLRKITNVRPATKSEKGYVKAIAKEARMAPGTATEFEKMAGW